MCNKEGEQDDRDPELFQGDFANLCLVRWEVLRERRRPDLRAKVARHADEQACQDQSLCTQSASITQPGQGLTIPVGPLK